MRAMTQSESPEVLSRLRPGQSLSIELITPAGKRTKGTTHLVGIVPGEYILIGIPALPIRDPYVFFQAGNVIVLRTLIEDHASVIALRCLLHSTISLPGKMLVLGMPTQIEQQGLRHHLRVPTRYPVTLQFENEAVPAVMRDLSLGGCALEVDRNGPSPAVLQPFTLRVSHSTCQLELKAEVCSRRQLEQTIFLGGQFLRGEEESLNTLFEHLLVDIGRGEPLRRRLR